MFKPLFSTIMGESPMYGSGSILPLERLQSTVHSLYSAITGVSPTDDSPSNLRLERFQPLYTTGVTPERWRRKSGAIPATLYHSSDSSAAAGHN